MKKIILPAFVFLLLIPNITFAAEQNLVYDTPTNIVNITYDGLNRILSKNTSSISINYTYNDQYYGTLTNTTFNNHTYKYEYDDRLRVTKETKIIDGVEFVKKNYYDSMDRLVRQEFSPGVNVSYIYNNQSKASKVLDLVNNSFYNVFDNVLNRTYANSELTEFTYDVQTGRLTKIKTGSKQDLNYTYDAAGNIILINDSVDNRIQRLTYDFLDRLVNATINRDVYIYAYNAVGNILKVVRNSLNVTKYVYGTYPVHAPSKTIDGEAGIDVHKLSEFNTTSKYRIFEFYLANEKNTTLTNVNWTVDFGDGNVVYSTEVFNVTTNETVLIIAENNYTNAGNYKVNATGRSSNASVDFENVNAKFGIKAPSLSVTNQDRSVIAFQLMIYNNLNETSQNVGWSCDNGIASNSSFTIPAFGYRLENFTYNFTSPSTTSLTCTANSTTVNDAAKVNFEIQRIKIENYNSTRLAENSRLTNFTIKNYYYPSTVYWTIMSDGQTFGDQVALSTNESAPVSQRINYTTDGEKTISVNISSGTNLTDWYNETFTLHALRIENYYRTVLNNNNVSINFTIKNHWPTNQSVSWNISDPNVSSSSPAELAEGQSINVSIEANYTTQGRKRPAITAYNGSIATTHNDNFIIKMIESVSTLNLFESRSSTIFEIIARNLIGQQIFSWLFDTGQGNIQSAENITLNTSEQVFIIIEANYTSAGVYPVNVTINSTSLFNDTSKSVAVTQ